MFAGIAMLFASGAWQEAREAKADLGVVRDALDQTEPPVDLSDIEGQLAELEGQLEEIGSTAAGAAEAADAAAGEADTAQFDTRELEGQIADLRECVNSLISELEGPGRAFFFPC